MSNNLKLLETESRKLLSNFEYKLTSDPCCRFKFLYEFNVFVKKQVGNDLDIVDEIISKYNFNILRTLHTKFFIYIMYRSCQDKVDLHYSISLALLVIYMVLINKQIPYCNNKVFVNALGNLRSNHLLKQYGSPVNACRHLANNISNEIKLASKNMSCSDNYMYIKLYMKYRTILSQSVKRIATSYINTKKKETRKISVDSYVQTILNHISLYGVIKTTEGCNVIKNNLKKLIDVDNDLLEQSIYEVLVINGLHPTKQKIINNVHKLKSSKEILQKIGLPVTSFNLYCLCVTYYKILED